MKDCIETARAKINLALHVRARREDGYHLIESLFAFADDGDRIAVSAAPELRLSLTGPFAAGLDAGEDNLALRAARAMQAHFGIGRGAAIRLDKRLPVAAGLGGGSADAAAVARALNRLWGLNAGEADLIAAVGALGADVPVCVASRMVIGRGIGDEMAPWPGAEALRGRPLLLVNPGAACPTGPVYRQWDGVDRGALGDDPAGWRNDLEAGAVALVPVIAQLLTSLRQADGASLARMSGSGASCFALFGDAGQRDRAARAIGAAHPGWWTMGGVIG
ncbi:MAG: 4-(cytidine 5'-diphospho)-2-C-methyl-D-erythritol kinase [Sphingobium sp.]